MIHDSLLEQEDEHEIAAILGSQRLRDFYLAMLQFLKTTISAIENLSSGLIEGSSETRNTLLKMVQSSKRSGSGGKSALEGLRIGRLSARAVEMTIHQFPFPSSDLIGSTVGFLLGMKGSREGAMAAVRVSLFGALCDTALMHHNAHRGEDGALERISRLTVRCYHHHGLIPEMDERFKWRKRQILRIAGAKNLNTPVKEAGAIVAQQVVEYISNPSALNQSSLLNRLYKGKDDSVLSLLSQIPDIVVAEVFELNLGEVRRLPTIQGCTAVSSAGPKTVASVQRLPLDKGNRFASSDGTTRTLGRGLHDGDEKGTDRPFQHQRRAVDVDVAQGIVDVLPLSGVEPAASASTKKNDISAEGLLARIVEMERKLEEAEVARRQEKEAKLRHQAELEVLRSELHRLKEDAKKVEDARQQAAEAERRGKELERRAKELEQRHQELHQTTQRYGSKLQHVETAKRQAAEAERRAIRLEEQHETLRRATEAQGSELLRVKKQVNAVKKKVNPTVGDRGLAQAYADPQEAIGDLRARVQKLELDQIGTDQQLEGLGRKVAVVAEMSGMKPSRAARTKERAKEEEAEKTKKWLFSTCNERDYPFG